MRTRAQWRRLTLSVLLVSACAHGAKVAQHAPVGRNEAALARVIAWIIRAAPDAVRYPLEMDGGRPSQALLREAADASGLSTLGSELRRARGASAAMAAVLSLHAAQPEWLGPDEARVNISYQVDGAPAVRCTVRVRPPSGAESGWALRSESGVECWPRPSRAPGSEQPQNNQMQRTRSAMARQRGPRR